MSLHYAAASTAAYTRLRHVSRGSLKESGNVGFARVICYVT
jgi:hypothetical protein